MPKKALIAAQCVFGLALAIFPCQAQVRVETAQQLIDQIDDGACLELKPGIFDFSAVRPKGSVTIVQERQGGPFRLRIRGVKDLTIRGQDAEAASVLGFSATAANGILFESCQNLRLSRLTVVREGQGLGPSLLEFQACQAPKMADCLLEAEGRLIRAQACQKPEFELCSFKKSGQVALGFFECGQVMLNSCLFCLNEGIGIVELRGGGGISFQECAIDSNRCRYFLAASEQGLDAHSSLVACEFSLNVFETWVEALDPPAFYYCVFEDNQPDVPPGLIGDGRGMAEDE